MAMPTMAFVDSSGMLEPKGFPQRWDWYLRC
jgi:hypothetical protein